MKGVQNYLYAFLCYFEKDCISIFIVFFSNLSYNERKGLKYGRYGMILEFAKRKALFFGVLLLIYIFYAQNVFAYTYPEMVRVGLESSFRNVSTLKIQNQEIVIGTGENDYFLKEDDIFSSSGFTMILDNRDYVGLNVNFIKYSEALECAEDYKNLGFEAIPVYLAPKQWSVYLVHTNISDVKEDGKDSSYSVERNSNRMLLMSETEEIMIVEPSVQFQIGLENDNEFLKLGGKEYRGVIEFAISPKGGMLPVNVLPMEEYLYGVVPAEMPSSYNIEALKAQAVAARTYALTKLGCHTGDKYQLCDTIHCQVYQGVSGETEKSIGAVNDTKGEIACYKGNPIEAVFSASSGGFTEDSENVWNNPVPYLRGVPEIEEYDCNIWEKEVNLTQLNQLLSSQGEHIGDVKDIVITKISDGGRIQELRMIGTNGEKVLTKEGIRTFFSPLCGSLPSKMFTINGQGGNVDMKTTFSVGTINESNKKQESPNHLLSSVASNGIIGLDSDDILSESGEYYRVPEIEDMVSEIKEPIERENFVPAIEGVSNVSISTVNGEGIFHFKGMGNGHGVGMSQKGAQGMAQLGYTYDKILKHYYQGITLEH